MSLFEFEVSNDGEGVTRVYVIDAVNADHAWGLYEKLHAGKWDNVCLAQEFSGADVKTTAIYTKQDGSQSV